MKILVTGSAGFIGYHLSKRLLEAGNQVVGIDSINDYYDVRLKYARLETAGIHRNLVAKGQPVQSDRYPAYRFIQMHLEDRQALQNLFGTEKFDAVVNLAAQAGVRYSIETPMPTSTATSWDSSTCSSACDTIRSGISFTPPRVRFTAAIRKHPFGGRPGR